MNVIDKIMTAPKWALYTGAGVLFAALAAGLLASMGFFKKPEVEQTAEVMLVGVPEAETDNMDRTKLQEYQQSDYRSPSDYWGALGGEEQKAEDNTVVNPDGSEYLDPTVYSELERYYIKNGTKTKAQVDAEHEQRALEEAARLAAGRRAETESKPLTPAQQDSIYFARLERAYDMAAKYSSGGVQAAAAQQAQPAQPVQEEQKEEEEEYRSLENENGALPVESMFGDNIISSLDDAVDERVHYSGGTRSQPVKATFLKNESLTGGQRVIMRLMQDLTLMDGTTIPANTHITGTVEIGRRMKIHVTMLHYGGKMFPTDLSIYDNDGTEGIYCPMVDPKSKGSAKKVARDVATGAAGAAATLFTGNILASRSVTAVMNEATRNIDTNGTVTVNVSSGYEFYICENVKKQ